jgi:hypothetical protein
MNWILRSTRVSIILLFALVLLLLIPTLSSAQEADTVWVRYFGQVGKSTASDIEVVEDGIVVTGTKSMVIGYEPLPALWLMKVDFDGNVVWDREFGDDHVQKGYSVATTNDGGFIVSGSHWIDGGANAYFVKTDADGNLEWEQIYETEHDTFAREIEATPDGGYIVTGATMRYGINWRLQIDAYVLKLDALGEMEWIRYHGGGWEQDETWSIEVMDDGYAIAGRTWSTGAGMRDAVLAKLDLNGDLVWFHTYGGQFKDHIYEFQALDGGGFIAAGKTESFGNGSLTHGDIWLMRFDENGTMLWDTYFGDLPTDFGRSVDVMDNGDFVVTGLTITQENQNQIFVGRANPDGDWIWTLDLGSHGMDDAWAIRKLPGGDIIVGGFTQSIGDVAQSLLLVRVTDQ